MGQKKTVSAKAVVADIKAGMTDEQLMAKYQLSVNGLQSLVEKLLKAGLISQADIGQRAASVEQAVELAQERTDAEHAAPDSTDVLKALDSRTEESASGAKDGINLQHLFGDWAESKTVLILLLIFATPIGWYGLYKTTVFSRQTKICIAIISGVWTIAVINTGMRVWMLGIIGIGANVLYKLLPYGKAARIVAAAVAGLLVTAMVAPLIETDSEKGKKAPANSTVTTPGGMAKSAEKSHQTAEVGPSQKLLCLAVLKCIEKTVAEVKRAGEYTPGCADALKEYLQTVKEVVPGAEKWDQLPLDQIALKMDQLPTHAKFPYHIMRHLVLCYKQDPTMPEWLRRQNCDRVTEIVSEFRRKCSDMR